MSYQNLNDFLLETVTTLQEWLSRPVDPTLLILFRIGFGIFALQFVIINFTRNWVTRYFVSPDFHFSFWGFNWVHPLPEPGMTLVLAAMGLGAIMITLGLFHRVGASFFMVGFVYFILAEKTYYQPHYDLLVVVSFLLIWMPLNRHWALDSYFHRTSESTPLRLWNLWILRFQILLVYAFATLNKINWDWFRCQPVWNHFQELNQMPLIGSFVDNPIIILTITLGVTLFEFALVLLLLWNRKTRFLAICLAIPFHLLNKIFWGLNVFPWVALLLTMLFLPPDWLKESGIGVKSNPETTSASNLSRLAVVCLVGFCLLQIIVPLRHYAYRGPVSWNNWGWTFSWRLRQDHKTTTQPIFTVTVEDYDRTVAVSASRHLTSRQAFIMSQHPALYWQFANFLARKYRRKTYSSVQVKSKTLVQLNGRTPQYMIDPNVDLTSRSITWQPPEWIMPLNTTIPPEKNCLSQSQRYLERNSW